MLDQASECHPVEFGVRVGESTRITGLKTGHVLVSAFNSGSRSSNPCGLVKGSLDFAFDSMALMCSDC